MSQKKLDKQRYKKKCKFLKKEIQQPKWNSSNLAKMCLEMDAEFFVPSTSVFMALMNIGIKK